MSLFEWLIPIACKAAPWLVPLFRKRFDRGQRQFELLYAPLRRSLMSVNVERSSPVRFPHWRTRTKRMFRFVAQRKFSRGVTALFDRGREFSLQYVTVGVLPYEELRQTIIENAQYADPDLLKLLQEAERACLEHSDDDPDGKLRYEEWQLCQHIMSQYLHLAKIFTQ